MKDRKEINMYERMYELMDEWMTDGKIKKVN